jgi:hypothetical protein
MKKSKEAQPILRRERHLFKIVTIYVVDKLNFNLQQLQRAKEDQTSPLVGLRVHPLNDSPTAIVSEENPSPLE